MILHLLLPSILLLAQCSALETTKTITSQLHEFQLNNTDMIKSALDMMPKECTKNGKKFKAGDDFEFGNLRYKCQNYGVYSIEGCQTNEKKHLKLGESVVIDNIKHQCLAVGSSVYYRQTTCGILGQPDCDKVPLPTGFEEAKKKEGSKTDQHEGKTSVGGVELPKGWTLVDGGSKQIKGTNASVLTQILMFKPTHDRVKRAENLGEGVGRVVGVEDMSGGDSGRPMMPMSMLMGGAKADKNGKKVIGTQDVKAELNVIKSGDKHDTGLEDLNARNDTRSENASKFKKGSVAGHQSITDWKGKTITVNGVSVGAGPGTFTFGNKPTGGGVFLKKDD